MVYDFKPMFHYYLVHHNVQHIPFYPLHPTLLQNKSSEKTTNSPLPRSTSCISNQEVSSWILASFLSFERSEDKSNGQE
jgi:hypothetical protein